MLEESAERKWRGGGMVSVPGNGLFVALYVLAGIIFVLGAVVLAGHVWQAVKAPAPHEWLPEILSGLTLFAVLLALTVIILLLTVHLRARMIRRDVHGALHAAAIPPPEATTADVGGKYLNKQLGELSEAMSQVVVLLREINENTLLDAVSRKNKHELMARQQRQAVFSDVDRMARAREWGKAKTLIEGLRVRYPDNPEVQQAIAQLEVRRKQAFDDDLAQTKKLINDLIAISAWDKATQQAEALLDKHPDMDQAKELLAHISAERQAFRNQQLKRLSADVQRNVAKKRWADALNAARQLLEKYPTSVDAEAIRAQLATLEDNAEIEKRQQLEEHIKDLIKRRNFVQALELAKHVINTYPDSPQAKALRLQLDKIEERAKQQDEELDI